jgi:hypothetical protein
VHDIENLIRVKRADLATGLSLLARTVDRRFREEGVLSFDGDCLHIEVGGGEYVIPAEGFWDCQVRVPAAMLLRLAKLLPECDTITMRAAGDKLWVNKLGLCCAVQGPWQKSIDLPIGTTFEQAREILAQASREELVAAGLGNMDPSSLRPPLEAVAKALVYLRAFGIEERDIMALIEEKTGGFFDDAVGGEMPGEDRGQGTGNA